MKETTKAYIAGLFDGEGSIGVYITESQRRGKTYTHFVPKVTMLMTDEKSNQVYYATISCLHTIYMAS